MPKCQFIDPKEVRKPGVVELGKIELADVLHILIDADQIGLGEELLFFGEGLLVLVHLDLAQFDDTGLSDLFRVDELTFRHFFLIPYVVDG